MSQVSDKLDEIYDNLNNIEEGMAESGAWQGHGVEECVKWCKEMLADIDIRLSELGVPIPDYEYDSKDKLENLCQDAEARRAALQSFEKSSLEPDDWSDKTLALELGNFVDVCLHEGALCDFGGLSHVADRLGVDEIYIRRVDDYWHVAVSIGRRLVGNGYGQNRNRALAEALFSAARAKKEADILKH